MASHAFSLRPSMFHACSFSHSLSCYNFSLFTMRYSTMLDAAMITKYKLSAKNHLASLTFFTLTIGVIVQTRHDQMAYWMPSLGLQLSNDLYHGALPTHVLHCELPIVICNHYGRKNYILGSPPVAQHIPPIALTSGEVYQRLASYRSGRFCFG